MCAFLVLCEITVTDIWIFNVATAQGSNGFSNAYAHHDPMAVAESRMGV